MELNNEKNCFDLFEFKETVLVSLFKTLTSGL